LNQRASASISGSPLRSLRSFAAKKSVSIGVHPWLKTFCPLTVLGTNICVELNDQAAAPTLAQKLGEVPHVSGLLRPDHSC
jgi:hypothetical protein